MQLLYVNPNVFEKDFSSNDKKTLQWLKGRIPEKSPLFQLLTFNRAHNMRLVHRVRPVPCAPSPQSRPHAVLPIWPSGN